MDRSVAQGRRANAGSDGRAGDGDDLDRDRPGPWELLGLGLVLVAALVAYVAIANPRFYNHFVWQADAFLHGQTTIAYPVPATADSVGNAFFQDVLEQVGPDGQPTGRGIIPFPPLPAVVLVPFVAIWGLATDEQAIAGLLGVVDVAIAWWALGALRIRPGVRLAITLFLAFGTVFWYAAELGTTWWFAHVVALAPALLAVGLAIRADPASQVDEGEADDAATEDAEGRADVAARHRVLAWLRHPIALLDRRQVLVGLLFGLAGTARLTVLLGAPFFILVGSGGSWPRRAVSAGVGAAIPVAVLVAYNLASTGHVFNPAYDHLYQLEALGYPTLDYHIEWGIEDVRYIPQNLAIMLFSTPVALPTVVPAALGNGEPLCTAANAVRGLLNVDCPLALPRDTGMSLLLTSPAWLLAIPALRLYGRSRLVTGSVLATVLVAVVNLMHFSQGWVQFGYRFSLDFTPFALPLVALGFEGGTRRRAVAVALIVVSVAVNAWGVYWGGKLGW